jgi:predicted nucleic acid-binding protein
VILVVDASAAVEFLLQTELGRRVGQVLAPASCEAPELLDAEVLSVLRRLERDRRLPAARAAEAVEDLEAWPLERVSHRSLLDDAWALRGHVGAYDALYVALARRHGAALVTAAGPLSRAPGLGVPVHALRT